MLSAACGVLLALPLDRKPVGFVLVGIISGRRGTSLAPSLALVLERAILIHCRFSPCYDFLMKDMQAQLDKLRADAAECALIRDLATDPTKRDLFTKLAEHYSVLANEVARAIEAQTSKTPKD